MNQPSASDLRDKILEYFGAYLITGKWSIPPTDVADKILALVTQSQQHLLTEILEQKEAYALTMPGDYWAVPVSVIKEKLESLKGEQ